MLDLNVNDIGDLKNNYKDLFKQIFDMVDLDFFFKICVELNDCDYYEFAIVDYHAGEKQKYLESDIDMWVDQYAGALIGDEYAGNTYILLPNGKYLLGRYTC